MNISIELGFDKLPPDPGEVCSYCNMPIYIVKYVPFVQVGFVENSKYLQPMCQNCYIEKGIDGTTSQEGLD